MTAAQRPVLICAGGTGGHVFPALALAEALVARGHAVALASDRRGADLIDAVADCRADRGALSGPRVGAAARRPVCHRALRPRSRLAAGLLKARRLMSEVSPALAVVVGSAAIPTVPTMIAASDGRRADADSRAERPPRPRQPAASPAARGRSRLTFETATSGLMPADAPRAKVVYTGNPVRAGIAVLAGTTYVPPVVDDDPTQSAGARRQPGRPHLRRDRAGGDRPARPERCNAGSTSGPSRCGGKKISTRSVSPTSTTGRRCRACHLLRRRRRRAWRWRIW